jgi:hypothetical protein
MTPAIKLRGATSEELRQAGLAAIEQALGPVAATRFLQQFERGSGDYTVERRAWADTATVDELYGEITQMRKDTP